MDADAATKALNHSGVAKAMPLLHSLMLILVFMQWAFYLKSFNFLSKWLQLMSKGAVDSAGFLLLYMLIVILFMFIFHCLGATFDDGNNWEMDEGSDNFYDNNYNDYVMVTYWSVNLMAMLRTSIGDLQPPTYPYWQAMIEQDATE